MTLGSIQPGHQQVWTVGKDGTNAISVGAVCVPDTATTPDSYKIAPAAASVPGPFVVCVNKAAAAADTAFSAAFPGSVVTVKAQGAIEVGKLVQCSASVAGAVTLWAPTAPGGTYAQAEAVAVELDSQRIVGRYLGHEAELTGKVPATAAADGETNVVIRLGGIA